jgi:hypothetical protein
MQPQYLDVPNKENTEANVLANTLQVLQGCVGTPANAGTGPHAGVLYQNLCKPSDPSFVAIVLHNTNYQMV